jgi:hypothetical protein
MGKSIDTFGQEELVAVVQQIVTGEIPQLPTHRRTCPARNVLLDELFNLRLSPEVWITLESHIFSPFVTHWSVEIGAMGSRGRSRSVVPAEPPELFTLSVYSF